MFMILHIFYFIFIYVNENLAGYFDNGIAKWALCVQQFFFWPKTINGWCRLVRVGAA